MGLVSEIGKMGSGMQAGLSKTAELSQESFMKLLLAQLKLQSPTNPFDSNTMMQQISQLTTLGATQDLKKTVEALGQSTQTTQVLEAARLVGQKVQIPSGTGMLVANEGLDGSVILPNDAEKAVVTIRDEKDQVVKTIELGASPAGVLDFHWDGLDASGNALSAGTYKISASASSQGESHEVPTAATFRVNSVALDRRGNGVILNVDGLGGVSMQEILKIL